MHLYSHFCFVHVNRRIVISKCFGIKSIIVGKRQFPDPSSIICSLPDPGYSSFRDVAVSTWTRVHPPIHPEQQEWGVLLSVLNTISPLPPPHQQKGSSSGSKCVDRRLSSACLYGPSRHSRRCYYKAVSDWTPLPQGCEVVNLCSFFFMLFFPFFWRLRNIKVCATRRRPCTK